MAQSSKRSLEALKRPGRRRGGALRRWRTAATYQRHIGSEEKAGAAAARAAGAPPGTGRFRRVDAPGRRPWRQFLGRNGLGSRPTAPGTRRGGHP